MRGKRKLLTIEAMSTSARYVYECDLCIWMMQVSSDHSFSDVQAAFDAHDCKDNSLQKRAIRRQL